MCELPEQWVCIQHHQYFSLHTILCVLCVLAIIYLCPLQAHACPVHLLQCVMGPVGGIPA